MPENPRRAEYSLTENVALLHFTLSQDILTNALFAAILSMAGSQTTAQDSDLKPNASEKVVLRGYVRDLALPMKRADG
jgi:hypothetical protein